MCPENSSFSSGERVPSGRLSSWENPTMAFSGVRISWLMFWTKRVLAASAILTFSFASFSSAILSLSFILLFLRALM